MAANEHIKFPSKPTAAPTTGSAGLCIHIPGGATTVSGVSSATGGIRPGGFVETDK